MKASEILRKLADVIDAKETTQDQSQEPTAMIQGAEPETTAHGIEGEAQVNTVSMVAPLQQKLELLKKAAGVDSAYDDGEMLQGHEHEGGCEVCHSDPCACDDGEEDPLNAMKRMAGLPVVVQMAGADNDIED